MPIIPLNDRKVASLAPSERRVEYFDRTFPSFGLRVTPNGIKTFFVRYRVNRKLQRLTLGKYPAVKLAKGRQAARDALAKVAHGLDPMADKRATVAQTFGALARLYIEKHAKPKKRSWREDDRMIRVELGAWENRQAATIRRREVRELLEAIVERGAPVSANRVLSVIRKIFNFGLDREWIELNPAHRMAAPTNERSRERVLSAAEIRRVWMFLRAPITDDELADLPEREWPTARRYLQLTRAVHVLRLITAQRAAEVLSMRWSDMADGWWTIPGSVAKNKLAHRVPLTPLVLAEIQRLKAAGLTGETDLFTGIRGTRQRRGAFDGFEIEDFQPRDLRRTAASNMTGAGVSREVVDMILNHVETGVITVYDRHSYDAEKRAGMMVWDGVLTKIIEK